MIEAYKIIEDTEELITYEYNSKLTWGLFASLAVGLTGVALNNIFLMGLCGLAMVVFFYIGLTRVAPITKQLKIALREGKLTHEGSKYSFSKPLRLTITKTK